MPRVCGLRFLLSAAIWIFRAAAAVAAPAHPNAFDDPTIGLVQLRTGAIVEGSKDFGGITPDFMIDWNSPIFAELRSDAVSLRDQRLPRREIVNKLTKIVRDQMRSGSKADYEALIKRPSPVALSEFFRVGLGTCRERAYVLHLALSEAGIPNRLAYARINQVVENANDHAFTVYLDGPGLMIADASGWNGLDEKTVAQAVLKGTLQSLDLFPRYWNPKPVAAAEPIPYDEFAHLVQGIVAKIPDLVPVWKISEERGFDLRLGGGVLRGVLHYTRDLLRNHSPAEILAMPPPSTNELLMNQDADRDFYAPDDQLKEARALEGLKGWEITGDRPYAESVRAGGSTLDKIRVSPTRIDDPLEGLRSFYEGKLGYRIVPEEEVKSTYWFREKGNSETALALRYLRQSQDFPELAIPEGIQPHLRVIATREAQSLNAPWQRYWVEKGLKKLFDASFEDPVGVLIQLRKYGFLRELANQGFQIPIHASLLSHFDDLLSLGFSREEVEAARKICNLNYNAITELGRKLDQAQTPQAGEKITERAIALVSRLSDYVEIFSFRKDQSAAAHDVKNKAVLAHFDTFLGLNPSVPDVLKLLENGQFNDETDRQIYLKSVPLAKTPADYIQLMTPFESFRHVANHLTTVSQVCRKTLNHFFLMRPTPEQLRELMSQGRFPDATGVDEEVFRQAAIRIQSPEEYLEIFAPIPKWQDNSGFQASRAKALQASFDHFLALEPTRSQLEILVETGAFPPDTRQWIAGHLKDLEKSRLEFSHRVRDCIRVALSQVAGVRARF